MSKKYEDVPKDLPLSDDPAFLRSRIKALLGEIEYLTRDRGELAVTLHKTIEENRRLRTALALATRETVEN